MTIIHVKFQKSKNTWLPKIVFIRKFYLAEMYVVYLQNYQLQMFGASIFAPSTIPSNPVESNKLITAIRDQIGDTPAHLVYVIDIVSVKFGGYFTPEIRAQLERYRYLQMLTLNDCGILSLENFPNLPALIRLDLVFNSIPGEHLQHLHNSKHIQTLMMGANKIEKLQNLNPLKGFRQLLQLDMINNPITKTAGYRNQVFAMFPTMSILDTLDKSGKDAYANATMIEAVSRIPDGLFDKSKPAPVVLPVHAPIHRDQKSKLKKALSRTGSLDAGGFKAAKPVIPASRGKASKIGKVVAGRSKASKAGLVFPVGRIRRHLKDRFVGQRVGSNSAVYLGAVLQYLTAELLEISGNMARHNKKARIVPSMIKDCLKNDDEMRKLLENVTFRMGQ